MINAVKLKEKITEQNYTISNLAKEIGINKSTFYRKLNADGETFLIKEVNEISAILGLSPREFNEIFFASQSHKCDK